MTVSVHEPMWLVCERGARSGEQGKTEWRAGIVVRNPKIDIFSKNRFLKNAINL